MIEDVYLAIWGLVITLFTTELGFLLLIAALLFCGLSLARR